MGTIQVRDDNIGLTTYQARVRRVGYRAVSKNFPNRAEAEKWIAAVEADLDRDAALRAQESARQKLGLHVEARAPVPMDAPLVSDATPFRDLMQRYSVLVSPLKKSAESEILRLGKLGRDKISSYAVGSLTPSIIAQWRDRRLGEVAPDTVTREMHLMSAVINMARREWGLELVCNPFALPRKPKRSKGRIRRLRGNELARLLLAAETAQGGFLYSMIQFAIETAMRQGEIVSLDWRYIDLDKRTAHLPNTKNGDHRTVPLSMRAIELLRKLAVIELTLDRAGPVFPGVTGEAVKRAFQNARKRAGIEDLRFHDLRHEAITRLFEKGLNPIEVASISGHKDMRMLQRYTHLEANKLAQKLN
ncbi:site-specific integrase [Herbaspirillum sp.]|uniref:site-specific integrase n=1 Tax=Herbaspirillum sp. TaxID=1890675 RepID=UPI001B188DE7|nr:site-specific integrase [Herbaspirillum sp.]MBO9535209.1 site-specific integrase [Herbaspirillum sp.]